MPEPGQAEPCTTFLMVGTGAVSERHADAIHRLGPRARLVGVVGGANAAKSREWAHRHATRSFASIEEGLQQTDAEAVTICTPSALHPSMALQALEHGRHVMIEKPAAVAVTQIDQLVAAAQQAQRHVAVISQHRFDDASEAVSHAVRSGALGALTSAVCSVSWWRGQDYFDSADWRGTLDLEGGGSLMNQGLHTLDLMLSYMGRPLDVQGYISNVAHPENEVEDVAVGTVRFENGALGVIHASTAAYPGLDSRLQLHGDRGSAVIVNDQIEHLQDAGITEPSKFRPAEEDPGDSMARQYLDLIESIASGTSPRVGLREHRDVIQVINGLYESARSGRSIPLP